jgi:hypothetical protein
MVTEPKGLAGELRGPVVGWVCGLTAGGSGAARCDGGGWRSERTGGRGNRWENLGRAGSRRTTR